MEFQLNKSKKLSDQFYDQLLKKIVSGELKEGDKLPSENDIAHTYKVSRSVIRESLVRLQADGLIYSRKGAGSFVKARPPEGLIDFNAPSDVESLILCLEARLPLEGAAAGLAAQRATKDDLAVIESALISMENVMNTGFFADKADYDFHMAIANATDNQFYVSVLSTFHTAIRSGMRIAFNLPNTPPRERFKKVLREHRAIYEAIANGDAMGADLTMRSHIQSARNRLINHQKEK